MGIVFYLEVAGGVLWREIEMERIVELRRHIGQ
jgi:hypothetical protein